MSGFDRAAGYFRDCWVSAAEELNILVLAPEFDQERFPGAPEYNYGNVGAADGLDSREAWSFAIIDRLFCDVKRATGSDRPGFVLFGHSAGAQFAHRYLAFADQDLAELVIAANAGWYLRPDPGIAYPAGVAGMGFGGEDLRRFLASPLVILLGDADADENARDLPRNPEAVAQGPHRLARGLSHFAECKALATRLGAPFGWRLVVAPGVGHDDAQVAVAASDVLRTVSST
jgi:pimeloyl-ACP methyl ester carboxylesterase